MRLKKILLVFLGVLIFLAGSIFIIGKYYNNEVKQFVFQRVNERLNTPVSVGDMELTLFADFPQASLRFSNVVISDKLSKNQRDTLLYADELFLSFNFWDIWNKEYKITRVRVNGGMFHLAYDKKGRSNLDIWKSDSTSTARTDFRIDLNSVDITNLFFRFTQPANGQSMRCFVRHADLSGNFSSQSYSLETVLNARMYAYSINGVNYLDNKDISLETTLNIDNDRQELAFSEVKLGINAINLALNGTVNYSKNASVDLDISGREISIIELLASMPDFGREKLKDYETEGFLTISSHLSGKLGNGRLPTYSADFTITDGSVLETSNSIKLSDLNLKGHYSTGFTGTDDSLNFKDLSGKFSSGSFGLQGFIKNFTNPVLRAGVKGHIDLEQLYHFMRWKGADTLSGQLTVDAKIAGSFQPSDTTGAQLINRFTASGSVILKQGRFKLREARQVLENVSGTISLQENLAMVKNLSFKTGNSDFRINGIISNLVPYIFRSNEQMNIEAALHCNRLDLGDFIEEKSEVKNSQDFRLVFPTGVTANLTASVGKLNYQLFSADQLSGRLLITPAGLSAQNLDLKAFNGRVQGDVMIALKNDHYELSNKTTLTNVELQKVFYQFGDFGQQIITHKELKGKSDARITVSAQLNNKLQVDMASLTSTVQLKIRDGELTNLQVLQDLAGYLKSNLAINAMVNCNKLAERLKKITFSTLENTISITDRKITIPEMTIKSSALDLNVNGIHSFDNHIDYGINFRMAEVFRKNEVTEDGYIQDDGTGMRMFIAISGTTDHPEFRYDKLSAAQARKEKFLQEKETFKSILKQEIGLFKGDTTIKAFSAPAKAPVKFELEFDQKKPVPTSSEPIPAVKGKETPAKPADTKKKKEKKEYDEKEYDLDDDI
ncbi:MAG: AsmA-like C-terminal region-containing protein [Bacteroidota bacterium]